MADSSKLTFVELMKQQPSYGPLMDEQIKYHLTALSNGTHWTLTIKGDQPDLPHVTIELISDDGKTIVRAVRIVGLKEDELILLASTNIGTYGPDKTLTELCQFADDTFTSKEVSNDKRREFTTCLVEKLGFQVELATATSTYYYTIEVVFGSGFHKCYLGTQNNDIQFPTDFPNGNISVYWKCDPNALQSSVINAVTELSDISTYMELGRRSSTDPITYKVTLNGPEKKFTFLDDPKRYNRYAIYTMDKHGKMAYLKPQDKAIVAVVQERVPFVFQLNHQRKVPFALYPTL